MAIALLAMSLAWAGPTASRPVSAQVPERPHLPSAGLSAPGVDVPCEPSADRPVPLILLHGTRSDRTINWSYLGPELAAMGFCVYSLDFPDRGQVPVPDSVAALAARVEEVKRETGAPKVSLFGHSLGGVVARDYVKRGGGLTMVEDVVAMGTSHTGYYTEPPGDQVDALFNTECHACFDQARGSDYMLGLNDGPDLTPGSASYTSIITAYDGVALPLESQYLPEGPEVANILLQDACPDHFVDHVTLALDPLVRDWVVNALERAGPADESRTVDCAPPLSRRGS
ncbi:MAG TPA: alpha/beta fold hydrolase [Actinomycetota bacterium]|nr:alpha/beta fold hydrolase [Actinomycetota bacterium]